MRHLLSLAVPAALALSLASGPVLAAGSSAVTDAAAKTYEHLANVILEMNAAENALVETILHHHHDLAVASLAAGDMKGAASEITNIASEGGKQVQAVRQRLLQEGHHHHHHSDAETEEDYMFVDAKEKKELLDFAGKVGRGGKGEAMMLTKEFEGLFQRVMTAE